MLILHYLKMSEENKKANFVPINKKRNPSYFSGNNDKLCTALRGADAARR